MQRRRAIPSATDRDAAGHARWNLCRPAVQDVEILCGSADVMDFDAHAAPVGWCDYSAVVELLLEHSRHVDPKMWARR